MIQYIDPTCQGECSATCKKQNDGTGKWVITDLCQNQTSCPCPLKVINNLGCSCFESFIHCTCDGLYGIWIVPPGCLPQALDNLLKLPFRNRKVDIDPTINTIQKIIEEI